MKGVSRMAHTRRVSRRLYITWASRGPLAVKSDFRAVKVKDCQPVKKSDKLLRFTLDDGTGTDRQILSGIAKWYKPEDLIGKTLMAIVNLPPRSFPAYAPYVTGKNPG